MTEPTEEQLLERVIAETADRYARLYKQAVQPYIDRLAYLNSIKPRKPILTHELIKLMSNKDIGKII